MSRRLPGATAVGPVALNVADLEGALAFYGRGLGFRVHGRERDVARLGAGGADLLLLRGSPRAPRPARATGLYHFAILVPSRLELARALSHLAEADVRLQGASDHLVSEALYLADPEGNGIEIYRDRPREEWTHDAGGLRMATEPLDLDALMKELPDHDAPWGGMPAGTVIGHVHLRVTQIAPAEAFYRDVLGFDLTTRYGDAASFLSAGGYHHHIAVNTWASLGAPPPPDGAAGLAHFVVRLPDRTELDRVTERVSAAGVPALRIADGVLVRDPSGNGVLLSAPGA